MACFLVPTAEAIVVTAVKHSCKKRESASVSKMDISPGVLQSSQRISFSQKLGWLTNMLWGGSLLLAFEHVWHGEVTPWFPFLTAAANPEDTVAMLHEMSTIGVSMALLVTLAWAGMVLVSNAMEKRAAEPSAAVK
ncbi:hypothetical protein SAMN05216343_11014 [Oscillibacter sp. PC13]|uniref:hypothetical protein n=1 Tax=Oscillibacter sp. PC13 TaxID=1855299 RepID=UPI0008EAB321|nr:hypothetical protein [Oscillibacter sp. PC13]SFP59138.1 hypothetical protein SAMN05216343_11014 [Oscillibacter sp. PC13]